MGGSRTAALLAVAVGAAGIVAAPAVAAATPSTLYVYNRLPCSDTGSNAGTQALPYCTISKAASVVQPGQTVDVEGGVYDEQVDITRSGTVDRPITFEGAMPVTANETWVGRGGGSVDHAHAFSVTGAAYVTIKGFTAYGTQEPILVTNSSNVTVDQNETQTGGVAGVRVTGTGATVTVSRNYIGSTVQVDSGAYGTIVTTNAVNGSAATGVQVTDAPSTVVMSNTITSGCYDGIDLEGTSTGSTIENNVVDTSGETSPGVLGSTCPGGSPQPPDVGITVASGAVSGTTSDDNVVSPLGGGPLYAWDGTAYTSQSDFTTQTGQGAHDVVADPALVRPPQAGGFNYYLTSPSYPSERTAEINSADAAAPGELGTDIAGKARVNDPLVPDTGAGSATYYDRGAFEFQDPITTTPPAWHHTPGGGPLDVTLTTTATSPWSSNLTYDWDIDGLSGTVTQTPSFAYDFSGPGTHTASVVAMDGIGQSTVDPETGTTTVDLGAGYTPVTPYRALDTRNAIGVTTKTPVPAGGEAVLDLTGVDDMPAHVSAVTLNVTVTGGTGSGYLTVYPDGDTMPTASNLNWTAGETVPNLVTVNVGNGRLRFHNTSGGTVHVVADLEGYYADSGYDYRSLPAPQRVLDTRHATGVTTMTPVGAGQAVALNLASTVPAGTTAVVMNVTVTGGTGSGYLTVYPDGGKPKAASNLNWTAGETVPNLVTVPVTDGTVDFLNTSAGTVHVIADLEGYFGAAGDSTYLPTGVDRVYDTRHNGPGALGPGATLDLPASLLPNVAPAPSGALGAVLNVTATDATGVGYLTVYPAGATLPTAASNLNYVAGETVPNLVSVGLGTGGVQIHNTSGGTVQVVVDFEGYYVPALS